MLFRRRRTRRRVTAFLGEFVLIFGGITAAIWFENANDARQRRALEAEILSEFVEALTSDTTDLRANLRSLPVFLASVDTVLQTLATGAPYAPELDRHFGHALGIMIFFEHGAAYEHLQSAGLDVISDSELRAQIARYYEFQIPAHKSVEELFVQQHHANHVKPQLARRFSFPQGGYNVLRPATPLDYSSLVRDVEFQNTLRAHATGLEFQIAMSRATLTLADSLFASVLAGRSSR